LHKAWLGQAEASSLTWGQVDMVKGRMRIRRHKTDTWFTVPIYPDLRPLMDKLLKNAGRYPGHSVRSAKNPGGGLEYRLSDGNLTHLEWMGSLDGPCSPSSAWGHQWGSEGPCSPRPG
jgi:hypothetical protein